MILEFYGFTTNDKILRITLSVSLSVRSLHTHNTHQAHTYDIPMINKSCTHTSRAGPGAVRGCGGSACGC